MPTELTEPQLPGMPEPKAPKAGTLAALKHEWTLFRKLTIEHEGLIQPFVAAVVLGVSRARVHQLMAHGQLEVFELFGKPYLSARSVDERRDSELSKGGRPRVMGDSVAA